MFDDVLRFWLDRGVDGFRVDVAHGLFKEESLRDQVVRRASAARRREGRWSSGTCATSRCGTSRRCTTSTAAGTGCSPSTTATGCPSPRRGPRRRSRWPATSAPTRCSQAFNFAWLLAPWSATRVRRGRHRHVRRPLGRSCGSAHLGAHNHDVVRHPTRYGGGAVGLARARAATLTMLALPGSAYLYQGEELGLEQVDVAPEYRRTRSGSAPARAAATAAGCRSRGAATPRRTASGRARPAVDPAARRLGRAHGRGRGAADPIDAGVLPGGAGRPAQLRDDGGRRRRAPRPPRATCSRCAAAGDRRAQLRTEPSSCPPARC